MRRRKDRPCKLWLASLFMALACSTYDSRAQTTPNVTIDILGTGTESLLGGDLTDPENDGEDAAGAATSPSWNWTEITSSVEPDFEGGEMAFNIFDNKVGGGNDKWCCDDPTADNPVWVAVQFPQAYSLTHFTVTSGNDSPDRDPTDWAIQGSNDGTTYVDIYHFTDTTVPWTERNQVAKFTLPGGIPSYRYFRYIAYETPGSLHQINEIEYFGTAGGGVDTDKDGMPDEFETRMGFNPNDATDAAKDFDGDGVSNLDEYKAGTNPIDTTKPTLLSVTTSDTFNTVKLTFSEEVDPSTATNIANYTFSPGLVVSNATYKSKVVTLTTAPQTAGGTNYTVTVKGVRDTSKNEVAANTTGSFFSYVLTRTGVLKFSYWGNLDNTGTAIDLLTSDPDYPNNPDLVTSLHSFNSRDAFPDDSHEQYGATIEGFITPTESGNYRFFIYSDDASALFLSTDDKEANLVQIAEETGCCNNFTEPDSPRTSEPIALVAGRKYFVRMIYKEGGGGDYGQVAWRKEGDTTPAASLRPIPGKFLSAAVDLPAPAEGVFQTRTPATNARNVSPAAGVNIVHIDGLTPWTAANVSLKFNGASVQPVFTKDGQTATVTYKPTALLASGSTNTVALTYPDPAGKPTTLEWSFVATPYSGPLLDSVKSYPGLVMGVAKQTADKGGHTGAAGDKAIDFGNKGGAHVFIPDGTFINSATAADELSVSIWVKRYDINDSSAFWFASPSSSSGERGFQAHTPWSNNNIYFDTAGCCNAETQRINAPIDTFPDYTGDISWWTNNWHNFIFTKKAATKNIFIDGKLFFTGENTGPLPTDFARLYVGADNSGTGGNMHAQVDDFAIFGAALTEAQAQQVFSGTSPSALGAGAKLLAFWDFNTAGSTNQPGSSASISRSGNTITISSSSGGTVQATDSLSPANWQDVGPAPQNVQATGRARFFRVKN